MGYLERKKKKKKKNKKLLSQSRSLKQTLSSVLTDWQFAEMLGSFEYRPSAEGQWFVPSNNRERRGTIKLAPHTQTSPSENQEGNKIQYDW